MLNANGSFYYDDRRLAQETGLGKTTIGRAKRFLRQDGYIYIKNGISKGRATEYWILRKPDRKASFVDISKPTNLTAKGINQSFKGYQNDTPNKVINKDTNKEVINSVSKDEDLKDGIKGLVKVKGVDYARSFYMDRGFSEAEVNKALEGLEE